MKVLLTYGFLEEYLIDMLFIGRDVI